VENGGATAAAKALSIQTDTSTGEVFAHSIAPRLRAKVDPPTEVSRSRGSLRKPFVPVRREAKQGLKKQLDM